MPPFDPKIGKFPARGHIRLYGDRKGQKRSGDNGRGKQRKKTMKAKTKDKPKTEKKKRVLPLTKKQEAYCRARADGASYREAYKEAGYKDNGDSSNGGSAYTLEHLSAKTKEILARIAQLKEQAEAGAIMDRQARQAMLTQLAHDEEGARADRIRALDLLNKMSGDYTERVIYEGTASVSIEDARREAWEALRGTDETRQ